jgi:hypothetical protein
MMSDVAQREQSPEAAEAVTLNVTNMGSLSTLNGVDDDLTS